MKFIILDNVFDNQVRYSINDFKYEKTNWYELGSNYEQEKLLELAANYFDLKNMIGYEMWCNSETGYAPSWHYDKDEKLFRDESKLSFPICSIVYYPEVVDLEGGDFITENIALRPLTNRAIFFSPGIYHHVFPYRGKRKAVSINPWDRKPRSYSQ